MKMPHQPQEVSHLQKDVPLSYNPAAEGDHKKAHTQLERVASAATAEHKN